MELVSYFRASLSNPGFIPNLKEPESLQIGKYC